MLLMLVGLVIILYLKLAPAAVLLKTIKYCDVDDGDVG